MSLKDWVRCERCERQIPHWSGDAKPGICKQCKLFDAYSIDNDMNCPHDKLVRCPECLNFMNAVEDDYHELMEEGSHNFYCENCDKDFEVETEIRYVFWSPVKKEGGKDES